MWGGVGAVWEGVGADAVEGQWAERLDMSLVSCFMSWCPTTTWFRVAGRVQGWFLLAASYHGVALQPGLGFRVGFRVGFC